MSIDPAFEQQQRIALLERRLAECERALGRPFGDVSVGGDLTVTGTLTVGGKSAATFETASYITPTLSGITIGTGGNANNAASWAWDGGPATGDAGTLEVWGEWRLGSSGFSVGTNPTIALPAGFSISGVNAFWIVGEASLVDADAQANNRFAGIQRTSSGSTTVEVVLPQAATTITASVPYTWAADDRCRYHFRVPCVRT